MPNKSLKGQKVFAWILIGVGIFHTLAHVLLTQPREALMVMLSKGMLNVMGPDWAATNFSICMSLGLGFAIISIGVFIVQMSSLGWQVPFGAAISVAFLFVFICYAAPNSGGWLALPSCGYYLAKAWPKKAKTAGLK